MPALLPRHDNPAHDELTGQYGRRQPHFHVHKKFAHKCANCLYHFKMHRARQAVNAWQDQFKRSSISRTF
jgi:hypothetical protein